MSAPLQSIAMSTECSNESGVSNGFPHFFCMEYLIIFDIFPYVMSHNITYVSQRKPLKSV